MFAPSAAADSDVGTKIFPVNSAIGYAGGSISKILRTPLGSVLSSTILPPVTTTRRDGSSLTTKMFDPALEGSGLTHFAFSIPWLL